LERFAEERAVREYGNLRKAELCRDRKEGMSVAWTSVFFREPLTDRGEQGGDPGKKRPDEGRLQPPKKESFVDKEENHQFVWGERSSIHITQVEFWGKKGRGT